MQCLSVKKGEVSVAFKTLPTGHKVSYVALGKGQPIQRDKIFIAQGQAVSGSLQCIAGIVLGSLTSFAVCGLGARIYQKGQTVLQLRHQLG